MIGVCIPINNEEASLACCLESVLAAAAHPALQGERVAIVVVLDCCDDNSLYIARQYPVALLECHAHNVGIARAMGSLHLLSAGARWLAFTDGDTRVSQDWIHAQLALNAHVVCGTVTVEDWYQYGHEAEMLRGAFEARYMDSDGHRHVHGANLGISAWAYRQVGGFPPLICSEDQALVDALVGANIRIAWSAKPRVCTSARPDPRASDGFGHYLVQLLARRRDGRSQREGANQAAVKEACQS